MSLRAFDSFMVVASSFGLLASAAHAETPSWAKTGDEIVKCAGVAAKGQNDCGAKGHDCSGKAATDRDPEEWVYAPKGLCEKLAGGKVLATKKVK